MKTINTIDAIIAADLTAYRTERNTLREAAATLTDIYTDTVTGTPKETAAAFIAAVGYDLAVVVVASLVNRSAWDGRISSTVKTWAANVTDAYDEEAANKLDLYTSIHMAHLNQIGDAMSRYQPEEPKPTEEAPQEAIEAADSIETTEDTTNTENATKTAAEGLTVAVSRDSLSDAAIENLQRIIDSKVALMKKALCPSYFFH